MDQVPTTFRRRPTNIEAMQFDGSVESASAIIDWVTSTPSEHDIPNWAAWQDQPHLLKVRTMDGFDAPVQPDWWVARGVKGEYYPIAPDVLAQTYDAVTGGTEGTSSARAQILLERRPAAGTNCWESSGPVSEGRHFLMLRSDIDREFAEVRELVVTVEPNRGQLEETGPATLKEDEDGAPFPAEVQGVRRFFLHRTDDVTGVHADGVIAIGVQFADSTTVLRWLPGVKGGAGSTAVWPNFADVIATHLHPRSNTELVWVD